MLQIKNVSKRYVTGELEQTALNNVSLNLRDNEFVAILGPSGSGKTTLLNIIGGLDRYDSGDLIINGISTKKYKSRDWDSYRNHTIGFVFQSYNLIEHQSILSNVELALTISGVKRKERRRRAKEALEKVGLGNQVHKKPNQLSGGQMQRVAIARALVNNPDVLLADEPTGALDTETSIQVMDLLKEVAKDRLVVMVTHNPELAEKYANRTVNIRDGEIVGDSNPFEVDEKEQKEAVHKNMGKSSMSLLTALSLSFNNLLTKKGRTFLTSFAGSIGIIGIALILALSTGVNQYIDDIQKDTMASYPILLEEKAMDFTDLMELSQSAAASIDEIGHDRDAVYSDGTAIELESSMITSFTENNLTEFKKYLEDENSEIHKYIGENGIIYSYNTAFSAYSYDPEDKLINTDGSNLYESKSNSMINAEAQMYESMGFSSEVTATLYGHGNFDELLPSNDGKSLSTIITDNYQVIHGDWPKAYDEVVLVVNEKNELPIDKLYQLGFLPASDYEELMKKVDSGEEVKVDTEVLSYEELSKKTFSLIPACDFYVPNENGTFDYIGNNTDKVEELLNNAVELKISGIIRPIEDADNLTISGCLGYTRELTDYLIDYTSDSEVVKAQKADDSVNVLNGMKFAPESDEERIKDTITYISSLGVSDKADMCRDMLKLMYLSDPGTAAQMMTMDETQLAGMFDSYIAGDPEDDVLLSIYDNYISAGEYDDNMQAFGVVSLDAPQSISIYTDSFEDKDAVSLCIEDYNKTVSEENQISYTDYIGLLMSSVTTIINIISYVLIAFVGVSLVVSSIMIGIITYISVLERTKEIGILRAVGASKSNISQVFISETLIVGLCAGLIGIGVTLLLLIPGNAIIHALVGSTAVNAVLPWLGAVILVLLSVVLTVIGGLIPSIKASIMDPVTALRSE